MALSYDNITEKYYEGETMQQNQWIVDEMNQVYKQGIRVDVNGLSYNPKTSANLMRVLENGSYMLDYEGDMLGRIVALHVDSVGPSEQPSYKTLRCKKTKKNKFFATFPLFESSYWYKGVRKSPKQ
mgnify:CR=1 FL=1